MKNNKGITLVALVITIIVLIILATVAINLTLGDNGIFQRAKTATRQMSIESAKEKLETEKGAASIRTKGQKVTLADYIATVREDNVADNIAEASSGDYAVISINGYVFKVEEKDDGISITYMGTTDGVSLEAPSAEGVLTITLSKTGWTNENITATTNGSQEGYTVQMSLDGITWTETNTLTIEENTTVYACLYNGIRYGAATTEEVTNIDKQKPTTPTITNPSNGEQTNQDVTITVTTTETGSGIAKYQVYYGGEWHDRNETSNTLTDTWTTYINETIKYKVIDNAGNESDEATTVLNILRPSIATESGTIYTGSQDFTYAQAVQEVTLTPGTYKLEVWGAQGGDYKNLGYGPNATKVGGKGGYSCGNYTVNSTTTLYVYVGGRGNAPTSYSGAINGGWNGGGGRTSYAGSTHCNNAEGQSGTGGGATDICTVSSSVELDSYYRYVRSSESYASRIIVAGGGGGGSCSAAGSPGGGATAGGSYAGTQSSAGITSRTNHYSNTQGCYVYPGGLGFGSSADIGCASHECCAGGGGGYYGGGVELGQSCPSGSGGSGFTSSSLVSTSNLRGDSSFKSPTGTNETGHSGDGYARITIVE